MVKTNEFIIAENLVNLYEDLSSKSQMTDIEKVVWQQMKKENYNYDGWNSQEIDFFYKKIINHKKVFYKPTSISKRHGEDEIQKPIFRISDYGIEDQVMFWKAFIENLYKNYEEKDGDTKIPNRKLSYNFIQKIDIDQRYDLIMQIQKDLKPDIEYPNLNDSPETNLYHQYRLAMSGASVWLVIEVCCDFKKADEIVFGDEYVRKIWRTRNNIHNLEIIYVFNLLDLLLDTKEIHILDANVGFDSGIAQKKYYVRWNLWLYVIMQNFQYLFKHGFIKKSDIFDIIDGIQKIEAEVQSRKALKSDIDIVDAYFDYNFLLKVRTWCIEEIRFGCLKPQKQIFVKSEDLFLRDEEIDVKKCRYGDQERFQKFNSGVDVDNVCNLKTFQRNLKFCEEFIEKYNSLTPRKLDTNSNKVLRAVYRALCINSCTYKRESSMRMAKTLLEDEEKKYSKHYLLGSSISRELRLEEPNGEEFSEETTKFMKAFYSAALNIINKSLPSVFASEECLNEAFNDLDEIMKKIVKVLYERIKCPVD